MLHGAASSSLQGEGAAPSSDWGGWEAAGWVPTSADGNGFAVQHGEDAALLAEHGLGSWRITIEWARLEPQETGRFLADEVDRYRRALQAIRAAGLEAWVCLAHTSLPGWFSEDSRGFLDDGVAKRVWPAHVDRVAETFGDLVDGWITFHEPVKYVLDGFLLGRMPPGRQSGDDAMTALRNLQRADAEAARLLHAPGRAPVASCQWLPPIFPIDGSPEARAAAAAADRLIWETWRDLDEHDLIGVSCSYALAVAPDGSFHPWPRTTAPGPMGWAPWHGAVEHSLHRVAEERSGRPLVLLTGAADTDLDRRDAVLKDTKGIVDEAVGSGLPIEQVHWWSAIDGYEPGFGFDVKTGLFDRDRNPTGITALALEKPPEKLPPDRAQNGHDPVATSGGGGGGGGSVNGTITVPGFLDLQCNGVGGIHLTDEPERLWEAAALLPRYGVTAWLPTIVSSPPDRIERALATLRNRPTGLGPIAEPLGLHLEGPFLSTVHRGAHPAELLVAPEDRGWSRDDGVALVTLAPELPGALKLTATLVDRGVVVSAGHSGATLEQMDAAIDAGVSMVTHLFNGMAGFHHREPSVPGAALVDERLRVGVIGDGVHVRPAAVLLAWRALGTRFVLVTDAVAALGAGDGGGYRLDDGTLAGADLGMDGAVRNLVAYTGCTLAEACAAASTAPAAVLGVDPMGEVTLDGSGRIR